MMLGLQEKYVKFKVLFLVSTVLMSNSKKEFTKITRRSIGPLPTQHA